MRIAVLADPGGEESAPHVQPWAASVSGRTVLVLPTLDWTFEAAWDLLVRPLLERRSGRLPGPRVRLEPPTGTEVRTGIWRPGVHAGHGWSWREPGEDASGADWARMVTDSTGKTWLDVRPNGSPTQR
ncbi:MAG: hypothetical protein EBU81_14625 [Proteobacteria bacterium]|nr:hypothetical protein [Pseudomonadota bacterium]